LTTDLRALLQSALGNAYTLERELGGGGMSRVFLAVEASLGRRVVIKVLPPELAAEVNVERFKREIQLAARLQHPHIVPLLAAGDLEGLLYYTMPFIDGESLRMRLSREGPVPIADAMRLLREVADALAYAHKHGVVHRDVKPENILLSDGHAAVADFGVAKALSASTSTSGTTTVGLVLGTLAYMAPEQAAGDPSTDQRADLYSLGIVAYELLTGKPPFAGRPAQAMLAAHATESPPNVLTRRPDLPPARAALVMRLLEKSPDERPQSADEVLRALDTSEAGSTTAPDGPPAAETAAPRRIVTRGVLAAIGVAAALAAVVFGADALRRSTSSRGAGAERRPGAGLPSAARSTALASVAVLPMANVGGDPKEEYFADGMTDELASALAKVEGLRVAARSSAFAFKGKSADARDVAAKLDVQTVIEGSVRRAGSRLRIAAQLINAADGRCSRSSRWADRRGQAPAPVREARWLERPSCSRIRAICSSPISRSCVWPRSRVERELGVRPCEPAWTRCDARWYSSDATQRSGVGEGRSRHSWWLR
jgi:serine/threonine-protein kinase